MPLTPERIEDIKEKAEKLSEQIPEKQREFFKSEYIASMTRLNEEIDAVLEGVEEELVSLLVAYIPRQPSAVVHVKTHHLGNLRELANLFMAEMSKVPIGGIKGVLVDGFIKILEKCRTALGEEHQMHIKINGEKVS
jgi:hypothetical protein